MSPMKIQNTQALPRNVTATNHTCIEQREQKTLSQTQPHGPSWTSNGCNAFNFPWNNFTQIMQQVFIPQNITTHETG